MNKKNLYFLLALLLFLNNGFAQRILSLEESKQLALQNNAKSKNSRLETEASHQVKKSAFTNYFPNISAGGLMFEAQDNLMEMETPGGNLPVYDGNPANLKNATQYAYFPSSTTGLLKNGTVGFVNVIQPVFAGGRILNGNKLASLGEEVSEYREKLTSDEILLKTEEQYWQIISLEEKQRTIKEYENLLNNLLSRVNDAFSSGIVMKNDVLKVKLKLSELMLNKSKLENGRKLAAMAFCQYIGIPYDSSLVLNEELKITYLPSDYYMNMNEALKLRTEYFLLEKSLKAEELKTKIKFG
ncbi:MAG: TolC family protein [Ignavibacteriaceae bacterium]